MTLPASVRASVPFPVTFAATGTDMKGLPVDLKGLRANGETLSLGRFFLDADGSLTVTAVVPGAVSLYARSGKTYTTAAAPTVSRYVRVTKVTRTRVGVTLSLTRSDPAPVQVQWLKGRTWKTFLTTPKGSLTLSVPLKATTGTRLRVQAPARQGMTSYVTRVIVVKPPRR